MPLLDYYQEQVDSGAIKFDPAQHAAISILQRIWNELAAQPVVAEPEPKKRGFFSSLLGAKPKADNASQPLVRGAYIWGGVGRGKTWLMDTFFERVPLEEKKRMHYHHFMAFVHDGLKELNHVEAPLSVLAANIRKDTRLLCVDEFHVLDIVDAMLLYGLFDALFKQGVTLVTTSNRIPDDLYKNGLQRDRFLPAIALLKEKTEVLELDNNVDYRMLKDIGENRFLHGEGAAIIEAELAERFDELAEGEVHTDVMITVQDRQLPAHKIADNVVWFSFDTLCEGPRSTLDYIELAERFRVVIISDMPVLNEYRENAAKRFLNLIDELYDRQVRMILSTAIPLESLYQGDKLVFEYDRAMSRLNEMQSDEYLQRVAAA